VTNSAQILPRKDFAYLLLFLVCITGALLALFRFLATAEVSEAMGVSLFLIAAVLLVGGYMVGLMVLALGGIAVLRGRLGKLNVKRSA
jgi:hypothetical protein